MTLPTPPIKGKNPLTKSQYRPKYPDSPFIHVADLVNPKTGKTYREENAKLKHNIPIGSLVELIDTGIRLFVVSHNRDCDQTPQYYLGTDADNTEEVTPGFANRGWVGGYAEESLKIIKQPQ